jgi:hypothetical protein
MREREAHRGLLGLVSLPCCHDFPILPKILDIIREPHHHPIPSLNRWL